MRAVENANFRADAQEDIYYFAFQALISLTLMCMLGFLYGAIASIVLIQLKHKVLYYTRGLEVLQSAEHSFVYDSY